MKKLTRKNLNALATVMPVLSETEQCECTGGAIYVNSRGEILGSGGTSFTMYVTEVLPDDYETEPLGSGDFSSQTDYVKQAILSAMGNRLGIGCGNLEDVSLGFISDPNSNIYASYDFGDGGAGSGNININTQGILYQTSNNYCDYELLLKHEMHHAQTPEDVGTDRSELEAYKYILNDTNASNCSDSFYNGLYYKYMEYYNKLSDEEKAKENFIRHRDSVLDEVIITP